MYFYIFFYSHVFQKNTNNITQILLPKRALTFFNDFLVTFFSNLSTIFINEKKVNEYFFFLRNINQYFISKCQNLLKHFYEKKRSN